ncbi:HNH endonuclease [Peribacillus castrilensis]|uniref:McrA protein n=2 Tax=Peribacillus TaxID=2675229 RepID=A0AAN2PJ28_9BACI|nr:MULTISPECIES: HNH endonuclease signature motif containing protein [Bacillaceae]MCF7622003.1 HNH endonuclease [Peribacillus frigoritolerans]MCP1156112.1 HNH endonuclease [Peribacillus frigoritolerans]MCT1392003.1 HNH endonuclease [Peribacillus frigoritolerans]CEG33231.1 McrA protein [Peribacillus simplex]
MSNNRYLTKEQIYKLFTIKSADVNKYMKFGMPHNKEGKEISFPKSRVVEWQQQRQQKAKEQFEVGKSYLNQEIVDRLGCSGQGGMRRSHITGTLALFTDKTNTRNPYQDRWINGKLHYTGMGQEGDQILEGNANKVLAETYHSKALTEVFLFETHKSIRDKRKLKLHKFIGIVQMNGPEYFEKENGRLVYKFPLEVVNGEKIFEEPDLRNTEIESQKKQQIVDEEVIKRLAEESSKRNINLNNNNKKGQQSERKVVKTRVYERNEYIAAYIKLLANGKCQLCEQDAPFKDSFGVPYLECHHIEWLSEGGLDIIENCVALCPNCHRKMHSLALEEDIKKLQLVKQE